MKTILTAICLFSLSYAHAQDADSSYKRKTFMYRVTFENVETRSAATMVENNLKDIFRNMPEFCENISQFIITSNMEIHATDIYPIFRNSDYHVKMFERVDITNIAN